MANKRNKNQVFLFPWFENQIFLDTWFLIKDSAYLDFNYKNIHINGLNLLQNAEKHILALSPPFAKDQIFLEKSPSITFFLLLSFIFMQTLKISEQI